MKVIFLDIDGVLNTSQTFINRYKKYYETGVYDLEIDIFRLEYLKEIIDRTNAKIVLSSSWRLFFEVNNNKVIPRTKKGLSLYELLNKYDIEIYDITTKNNYLKREEQIDLWLNEHDSVDSFVIIDDESSHLQRFINNGLIKTSTVRDGEILENMDDCIGLCEEHISMIVDILNSKKKIR